MAMLQEVTVGVPRATAKFAVSAAAMAASVNAGIFVFKICVSYSIYIERLFNLFLKKAYKTSLTAMQHLSNVVIALNGELTSAPLEV